jgi:NAD(P)-dependent dehydrogenase (short-subunit alcohol dehydrogenase family)
MPSRLCYYETDGPRGSRSGGSIINVGSVAALKERDAASAVSDEQGGVANMTRAMAAQYGGRA